MIELSWKGTREVDVGDGEVTILSNYFRKCVNSEFFPLDPKVFERWRYSGNAWVLSRRRLSCWFW